MVRLAQGMLHAGKGLVSICPLTSEKLALNIAALSGILLFLFSCIDTKCSLLSEQHFMLLMVVPAIRPR